MDDRATRGLLPHLLMQAGGGWQKARPVLPWIEKPPYPIPDYAQPDPIIGDREDRAREYLRNEDKMREFFEMIERAKQRGRNT